MTLNDILVAALLQLDRGHDPQTLDVWRDKFTRFANDAQDDLSIAMKPRRSDTILVGEDKTLHLGELSRVCRRILGVYQDDKPLSFISHCE